MAPAPCGGAAQLSAGLRGLAAHLRRRPALAAALVYAVITVAFLAPALLPGKTLSNSDVLSFQPPFVTAKPPALATPTNPELGDAITHLQLFLHHTAREMPHIPLWDPYIAAGRPYQANSQSAVFGLYTLPTYLLPFWTALSWIGVVKLWVAAFGMFLLSRALGMRFGGALLAGIVFALNLKMVTWLSYQHMSVWTFIPWLLLLTDRIARRPSLLAGAGLAAVVALQFLAGHAESSFHALMAAAAFLVLRLWQARRDAGDPPRIGRSTLAFGASVLAGAALAAVSLLPLAELLLNSADLRDRSGESVGIALDGEVAIGAFLPDWWGRPTQTPIRLFVIERALYVGALPLMLVAAALILRPRAERIAFALFGALWLAVVLSVPPFLQVVSRLPVFSSGHNTRLIILTLLCASVLAGWGFDDLAELRRASRRRRQALLGVAAALLVLPLLVGVALQRPTLDALVEGFRVAWLLADPPGEFLNPIGQDVVRMSAVIMWLVLAGCGLLLVALRLGRHLGPALFVALGVMLVCLDLFRAGMGFNPAIDQDVAEPPRTEVIGFLERQRPARFVSTLEIPQNVIAFEYGLYEAKGYDLPILLRYDRFWRRNVAPDFDSLTGGLASVALELRQVTPRALRALRLLGVTHLLRAKSVRAEPPDRGLDRYPALDVPGLEQVYDGPDARVYRLAGAMPRAFVVGSQRVVADGETARRALASPDFDARSVALTEERLPGLATATPPPGGASGGQARIVSYEHERVVVRARSNGRGLLVLSDNHFPGWKAEVDGRPVPIERVDYLFRGVRIGPGAHTVEFRYEPLSWRIGWTISLVSLVGLGLVVLIGLRRRRRGGNRGRSHPDGARAAGSEPMPAGVSRAAEVQ